MSYSNTTNSVDHGVCATGDSQGNVFVHDLPKGNLNQPTWGWNCHGRSVVNCVRFAPNDANMFATAGKDGQVRIWDRRVNYGNSFCYSASAVANHAVMSL